MRADSGGADAPGVASPTNPFSWLTIATLSAWLVAGVGLWFTRAVLDVIGDERGDTRVALLPSGPELLGLIVLVLVIGVGGRMLVHRWFAPRRDAAVLQISVPLFGLIVFVLPYLPWLPDRWDALRSFAGPLEGIVWAIVLGQVAWTAWALWPWKTPPRTVSSALIFALSLLVFGAAALRVTRLPFTPGGDEPHYLVMMQSLWRDGDLKIENNHTRRDYAEYFRSVLRPDYLTRGTDRQIYSIHPVGLPFIGAPVYALAGYRGIVVMMVLLSAITATLMWRWTEALTRSAEAATFAWAAVCLSTSIVLQSFAVYPEMMAACCVMVALAWNPAPKRDPAVGEYLVRGLAVAALPWLSTKYAPMAAVLVLVLAFRTLRHRRALISVVGPFAISLAGWFWFFHWIWGRWSPRAQYGSAAQMSLDNLTVGAGGLLFDQEYGVLAYAPVLAIGLTGFVRLLLDRRHHTTWRTAEAAVVFIALFVTAGAFELWWGGSAAPGRMLVAALPLLGLPIAVAYERARTKPVVRAAYQVLLLIGLAVAASMVIAQNGLLIPQDRDGSSRMLQWLSPLWPAWTIAPSFASRTPALWEAVRLTMVWMAAAAVVAWLCHRSRATAPGTAALKAGACIAGAVLAVSLVAPSLGASAASESSPAARMRVPILDTFDANVTPVAVIYDPFTLRSAGEIPPRIVLTASPGSRTARQPRQVFLNARFALPAGAYEVELDGLPRPSGPDPAATIGLQVGRNGPPIWRWQPAISPEGVWRMAFALPIDAEFVGLQASRPFNSAQTLLLRPVSIVDASKRSRTPPVLSAMAFGATSIFFHGEGVYPETSGFWLRGQSSVQMTIAPSEPGKPVTLRTHCGAQPNTLTLETAGWREEIALVPDLTRDISVPASARSGPMILRATTTDGFVPAMVVPGSTDRRLLGCWVEVVHGS